MPLGHLAAGAARRLARPTSSTLFFSRPCFYKSSRKEGYERPAPKSTTPYVKRVQEGFKELKTEFALLKEEMLEKLRCDPKYYYHGDTEVFWKFDSTKAVDDWIVTADRDNDEGFSTAEFYLGPGKTGIFAGYLDTRPPKDGRVLHTGYCNIRSPRASRSFGRNAVYDWSMFTHLVVRVRGDGRSYMLNIGIDGYFDVTWHLIYNFALYTRGGPYWQTAKIPFSRFFLSNKGRIQDKQGPLPRTHVRSLGITVADGVPGPFRLEIDYVGACLDEAHTEEFAYEMYEMPTNYVPAY